MKKILTYLFVLIGLSLSAQVTFPDTTKLKARTMVNEGSIAFITEGDYKGTYRFTYDDMTPNASTIFAGQHNGYWEKINASQSDLPTALSDLSNDEDFQSGAEVRGIVGDTADDLRSDINALYRTQLLTNVSQLASADTGKVAFVRQSLRGGVFYYYPNETATARDGVYFTSDNGGRWVRYFTGSVSPEWWGAKGDGVTEDHEAFQKMLTSINTSGLSPNIELANNKTYLFGGGANVTNINVHIDMNNSTIQRADMDSTSLKYQAANGQNYVVVNNPSMFTTSDDVVVLKNGTDQTSYNHSAVMNISSINGDTLFFTSNIADNNPSTPAGDYTVGSMVYSSYNLLTFGEENEGRQKHTVIIENGTFDGNKSNWYGPNTWTVDHVINHDPLLIAEECRFIDNHSDVIIGNVSQVINCFFQNNNVSGIHFSYGSSDNLRHEQTAVVRNCVFYDNCKINNGHSEGVIVWSNAVGNVLIENTVIDTSGFGALGTPDSDTKGNLTVRNSKINNCASIQQLNYATNNRKEIRWEGNKITNSGALFYQYLTDSNTVYFVNNEVRDSCSVAIYRGGTVHIEGNVFENNYQQVILQESHDLKVIDNTFYNTSLSANLIRNVSRIDRNNFFNTSANDLINNQDAFIYVGSYFSNYGAQRVEVTNNLIHENNDNSTGSYRGIYFHAYNCQGKISNNRVINIEKPIRLVNTTAGADTTRIIEVTENTLWVKTRTANQGADNAFQNNIILGRGSIWKNNWIFADKYQTEVLKRQTPNDRIHTEFIDNTVWIQNNGGKILERNITDLDNMGLYIGNTYNGTEVLGDRSAISADQKTYTISDRNLNLQIKPNFQMPVDFIEWQ